MAANSLGLSRAYAVLRQLDKLRETDITDPILPPHGSPLNASPQQAAPATQRNSSRHAGVVPSPVRSSVTDHQSGSASDRDASSLDRASSTPRAPSETQPATPSGSSTASSSARQRNLTSASSQPRGELPASSKEAAAQPAPVLAYVENVTSSSEASVGSDVAPDPQRGNGRQEQRQQTFVKSSPHPHRERQPDHSHAAQPQKEHPRREILFSRKGSKAHGEAETRRNPPPRQQQQATPSHYPNVRYPFLTHLDPSRRREAPRAQAGRVSSTSSVLEHSASRHEATSGSEEPESFFDEDKAKLAATAAASGALRQMSLPYRESALPASTRDSTATTEPEDVASAQEDEDMQDRRQSAHRERVKPSRRESATGHPAAWAPTPPPPPPPAPQHGTAATAPSVPPSSVNASVAFIESFIDSGAEDDEGGTEHHGTDPSDVDEPKDSLTASPSQRRTFSKSSTGPSSIVLHDNLSPGATVSPTIAAPPRVSATPTPPPTPPQAPHASVLQPREPVSSLLDTSVEAPSSILDHYRGSPRAPKESTKNIAPHTDRTPAAATNGSPPEGTGSAGNSFRRSAEASAYPQVSAMSESGVSVPWPQRWAAWKATPAEGRDENKPSPEASESRAEPLPRPALLSLKLDARPPARLPDAFLHKVSRATPLEDMSTSLDASSATSFSPSPRKEQALDETKPPHSIHPHAVAATAVEAAPVDSPYCPTRASQSGVSSNLRHSSPPPPPTAPTVHVPLLAYVEELVAAGSHTLLKELTAMQSTCGDPHSEDCFTDCLALTVLVNRRNLLRHVVVPLLVETLLRASASTSERATAENTATVHAEGESAKTVTTLRQTGGRLPRWALRPPPEDVEKLATARQALCALIGLGDAAAEALPVLQDMLERKEGGDARLVALAIRCVGGEDGLSVLEHLANGDARHVEADVRCAALYGLGALPYSVLGHTTVLCVMNGETFRAAPPPVRAPKASEQVRPPDRPSPQQSTPLAMRFYEEPTPDGAYVEITCTAREPTRDVGTGLRTWRRLDDVSSPTQLPVSLQSRPPYRLTHILLEPSALCERLAAFIASEHFRPQRSYPSLVLVLRDYFLYFNEQQERAFSKVVRQSQREAEGQLGEFLSTVERSLADPSAITMPLLLLPYAYDSHWTRYPDTTFRVEQCLLRALLDASAPSVVKEQALLSVASLPRAARPHVGQAVMDFAVGYHRRFTRRWSGGEQPSGATEDSTRAASVQEAAEEEAVLVAAAVALGYTSVTDAAGYAGLALQRQAREFLLRLLTESPRWRLRHAACVGLGGLGAGTLLRPPTWHEVMEDTRSMLLLNGPVPTPQPSSSSRHREGRSHSTPPRGVSRSSVRTMALTSYTAMCTAVKPVVAALLAALAEGSVKAETICWSLLRQGVPGLRALLGILSEATPPSEAHVAAAHALGKADVDGASKAAAALGDDSADSAIESKDEILDEVIVGLTHAIVSPGVLSEEAVLVCVRSLALVVDRNDPMQSTTTMRESNMNDSSDADDVDPRVDEAASYYKRRAPCDCFLVLRSIIESCLFSYSVLRALFHCVCKYGGCYGELYASQTIVESPSIPARAAAAYGLRACGAKAARAVAMAMSDDAEEVRREGFDTLEAIGVEAIAAVVHSPRRPPLHREQILAALRDCLLRDVGRGVRREAAQALYDHLTDKNGALAVRRI